MSNRIAPTPAEVAEIVAVSDRIVRNLRITHCYASLADSFRGLTNEGANWCTFATWASRQAGATIRGEDLGDRIGDVARGTWSIRYPIRSFWRMLLRRGLLNPDTRLGRFVHAINTPFDAFERASEAVAAGNLKVFEEIGLEFARYLHCCDDPAAFTAFLNSLKAGPPPHGQDLLRAAFAHYQQARGEALPARRAQWMLLANLEIGFHEQMRLQSDIERAMNSGPDTAEDLKRRLVKHFGLGSLGRMFAAVVVFPARYYQRFVRAVTRRVISETLMVLRTPNGVLLLGSNLEAPQPEVFRQLNLTDLVALLRKVEPASCRGCGAEDWANLDERMHYIFHLFSAFHESAELFHPPFTQEQIIAFKSGRIPRGRL